MERQIEREALNLKNLRGKLDREMREFTELHVTSETLDSVESEIDRIKDKKSDYQDSIEDFVQKWTNSGVDVQQSVFESWTRDISAVADDVRNYAMRLRAKKKLLLPTYSERSLVVAEATLKVQELTLKDQQEIRAEKAQEKVAEASSLPETEANLVMGECSVLGDMLTAEGDWSEADDAVIGNAMRNIAKWQEQMNTVERAYRKFENMATRHNFTESRKEAVLGSYEDYRSRFETARDAVKNEDLARGLFTLEPPRTDIIKYPSFSGLPSQDYLHFKDTMELRFRENKVKKREQVAKLRECLKGAALGRVPDGIMDIAEAFRRLSEAFGNPNKVMGYNIKALEDLGMLPPEKTAMGFNYIRQIEWYLKLEVILGKILELSKRSSKLAHEAFSSATYRKLWSRFPTSHIQKLVKVPGEDADRLQGIVDKIVKMREQAQLLDDECGSSTASVPEKKPSPKVIAEVFFRPAKRFEECRICVHLSATSSAHHDLFENHLSNYATGCPRFMEATSEKRKVLVSKVKLCTQCFNPELIVNNAHMKECPFNKKKNNFSCTSDSCKEHMWICLAHKQKNKSAMEKFRQEMQSKGHSLAMASYIPLQACSAETESAVKRIRRGQVKRNRDILPVPSGEPLFLFHATQGKTKPVNTFYDTGCSHAVFMEGIPGNQLRGQLVCRGPFSIGGV